MSAQRERSAREQDLSEDVAVESSHEKRYRPDTPITAELRLPYRFAIVMPTLVSFLWHMHQPFYKDVVGNSYVMPWAYLHATKDYFGMAELSGEFPDVHQTFNLVPSLVLQLEEYAAATARIRLFDLAFKPAEESGRSRACADSGKVFSRPRADDGGAVSAILGTAVTAHATLLDASQELRDIQVWWTLAWMDHDRRPAALVEKGQGLQLSKTRRTSRDWF